MKNSSFAIGGILVFVLFCLFLTDANATSNNSRHELGVYSLYQYGQYNGEDWKSPVQPLPQADPAENFWYTMTGGTSSEYAHHASCRRRNFSVNRHTVFPISGDGWRDWDQFDMVFFYGHNNMFKAFEGIAVGKIE